MIISLCLCLYLEWKRWNIECKQFNLLLRTDENATSPEAEAYLRKNQGNYEINLYQHTHACTHTHTRTHTHTHIHTHTYTYIHAHTHIHTYTHIHTHAHTHARACTHVYVLLIE